MSALVQTISVPHELHHQRVDVALARLLPEYSRSKLSEWLKAGLITVDGENRKPKDKICANEIIRLNLPDNLTHSEQLLPEAIPLQIVFEDQDILVVNKPAGLVVHPGAGNPDKTLVNALLYHDGSLQQLPRAGIIHRLDKDTTGLLLVAKSLHAYTDLIRQMQAREIKRNYLALVQGCLLSGGRIETFYGRHPKNRLKMAVCRQGKYALTEYDIMQQYADFTLLDVTLQTGRTHQIRVHMAHIKHPIVGDPLYGCMAKCSSDTPVLFAQAVKEFNRQALHAHQLAFTHPGTGQLLALKADVPDDFAKLLNLFKIAC